MINDSILLLEEIGLDNDIQAVDNEIAQVCESFGISSLNDLTLDMIEELTTAQIRAHTNTTRGGLLARRTGRNFGGSALVTGGLVGAAAAGVAVTAATSNIVGGAFSILFTLSEAGIIPTTEKHAFIRFQGLASMHAQRLDNRRDTGKAIRNQIEEARKEANRLDEKDSESKVAAVYSKMISTEAAIISFGYIMLAEDSGLAADKVKELKSDLTKLKTSFAKGSGVWNRLKSLGGGSWVTMLMPVLTFIGQFQRLDKKAPKLKLVVNAQKQLNKMMK